MQYFRGIYYFFGLALTADITAVGRFQRNVLQNVSQQNNKQNAVYLQNFRTYMVKKKKRNVTCINCI